MAIRSKLLRAQLAFLKPILDHCSVETARKAQDQLGRIMYAPKKGKVSAERKEFPSFVGEWIIPKKEKRDKTRPPLVILYLHGGGYVSGNIDYARGFGATLAVKYRFRVFAAAYRLGPENRHPAALEDAETAFSYLTESGFPPERIVLCGESAGGGLCFSLALALKARGIRPAGIIALSPWTDLTQSGASCTEKNEADPALSKERLDFYAGLYTDTPEDPLVSPLFGDLAGIAPSLIFVGGDEVLLDDSRRISDRLLAAGSSVSLTVTPGMWHVYPLYGVKEAKKDFEKMERFLTALYDEN
ncbi:MAG: alpha/beta hydrolase [Clostridia bacterium]|nr:alpha/beta hydrolase [Clostridia bacterium]